MSRLYLVVVIIIVIGCSESEAGISQNCLKCICKVEGCEKRIGKCNPDRGSLSCGPYQIKKPYWIDCGKPGGDWERCTKQMACSETCVRAYMRRYAANCAAGQPVTCETYARVHNGGPFGCRRPSTLGYWNKVKTCCGSRCSNDFLSWLELTAAVRL